MSRILAALFGGVQQSPNTNITAANSARAISAKEAPTFKHPHAADCSDGDAICRAFIILHLRVGRRRLNVREGNVRLWAGADRLLLRPIPAGRFLGDQVGSGSSKRHDLAESRHPLRLGSRCYLTGQGAGVGTVHGL
jgi:hypothetical protein